jgi:hypothetical protein
VMIAKILHNTEEIKKNQTTINGATKSYSQAAASPPLSAPIYIKPQPIETKRKEVKIIITERAEKEKSEIINIEVILNII